MPLPPLDLSELRVLIVEDNPYMRQILRMMLTGYGVRSVFEAEDGAEALELVASSAPDLVLTDWLMPIVNGAELTRMIRQMPAPACFLPIIAITAHTEKRRILSARDSGITEVMCKPVSARGLYLRIANCILNPRDFVRSPSFFGPDRRRFQAPLHNGTERRGTGIADGYTLDETGELSQSQENAAVATGRAGASDPSRRGAAAVRQVRTSGQGTV
ncbi:response regulator [Stappia taiwanensis]|uniref:Response regulator n=1 Tax=Stappia taiwanensis TaxID=992267 RepID=A0A838XGS3_9HYPH|nr:response regulator [Stappia taiwanensis]MBA4610589.1 response regulator [Stappia taiwanensis]GGE83727.1 hypothetical protein GCM10007285_09130 [Stappia taiwanensis]